MSVLSETGRRCQVLTNKRYFGLAGLTFGTSLAFTSRYWYGSGSGTNPQFFLKLKADDEILISPLVEVKLPEQCVSVGERRVFC